MIVPNSTKYSWYTADTDVAYFNSGTTGGTYWRGRLIGIADYGNNPDNHPVILKLETGTGSDYFVSFNRARGVNDEVQEASDRVLIHRVEGGHGTAYSQSMLMATLYEGRTRTIENWRESGIDLEIKVIDINFSSSPDYADVLVKFGPPTQEPTAKPSKNPTSEPSTREPTPMPTNEPTTNEPTTSEPTTNEPTTNEPTTTEPTTSSEPTHKTSKPTTNEPTTPKTTTTTATTTTSTTTTTPETTTTTSTVTSTSHVTFDSGTTSSTSWSGYMAEEGSDFAGSESPTRVYLYTGSSNKLYLEYKDRNLYFRTTSSTGDVHTMGTIAVGASELVANWRYTGYDLAIEVGETNVTDEYARVKIVFRP